MVADHELHLGGGWTGQGFLTLPLFYFKPKYIIITFLLQFKNSSFYYYFLGLVFYPVLLSTLGCISWPQSPVDYAFDRLLIEIIITLTVTVTTKWRIHSTLWHSPLYFSVIFRAWRQKNVITPVIFGRFTPNKYVYNTFKYASTRYTCFGKKLLPTTLPILAPKTAGITPVLRNTV